MRSMLDLFLELQKMDKKLYRIKQEQNKLPRLLSKQYTRVQQAKEKLEKKKEEIKRLQLTQREKEGNLGTIQSNIDKKQGQLNTIKTNKEYSALTDEIKKQKELISTTEEEILEIMNQIEAGIGEEATCKEEVTSLEKEFNKEKKEIEEDLETLLKEQKALEGKRQGKAKDAKEAHPRMYHGYERLIPAMGGQALYHVEDEACTACHMQLMPKDLAQVYAQKIIDCEGCGAMIYSTHSLISS